MKTLANRDLVRLAAWHRLASAGVMDYRAEGYGRDGAAIIHAGTTICGDPGYYQARAIAAIVLVDGEPITVGGIRYRVKVMRGNERGPVNCDPIHLIAE